MNQLRYEKEYNTGAEDEICTAAAKPSTSGTYVPVLT